MPPELLHVLGYVTGATLYTMLLVMVLGDRPGDRLTVAAALLGLAWNVGELLGHGVVALSWQSAEPWIAALSFAALGFLPAVVIHSVARTARDASAPRLARWVTSLAYGSAGLAAALHIGAAATSGIVPESRALVLLTASLALLAPVLVVATRAQGNIRRAAWMTALAVFAVSALHVGTFHGPRESWAVELLGHHASVPLAFALLYQDYRFALADLFLKHALNLVLVVAVVFGLWSIAGPRVAGTSAPPGAIGLLLALWVASSYLFPLLRRGTAAFIDRVVLMRSADRRPLDDLNARVQVSTTEHDVLTAACESIGQALNAARVTWEPSDRCATSLPIGTIEIPTAEAPHYRLTIGRLAGGRRLLSGDIVTSERAVAIVGRRLDTLRLTAERYERVLHEREMRGLAAEAELAALRAQIQPHFLFNALTTIGYLIKQAPDRAVTTLLRLTTLLRSVLRVDGEFTTLRRETELVACYLEIERERFEERLQTELDIPDSTADVSIPPLLLQPLVENAVKHGIAASRSGGAVFVGAALEGSDLCITVRNTGAPLRGRQPGPLGGVGLRNVERRLANYYGDAATFSLVTSDLGETVAALRIPAIESGSGTPGSARRA